MRFYKALASAVVVGLPLLLTAAPADALTSRQYLHQGRGHYVNSSGTRVMTHGSYRHHRMMRHHRHRR